MGGGRAIVKRPKSKWRALAPRKHRSPEERFRAALHPLPALFEALWNLAYWETDKRRRKRGVRKVSVLKVYVWCQASQARLIARYREHLAYLREPRSISKRTLTRQITALKRDKLVAVVQPSPIYQRDHWVSQDNVYTVTYLGKLWIKRYARAVTNQLVV